MHRPTGHRERDGREACRRVGILDDGPSDFQIVHGMAAFERCARPADPARQRLAPTEDVVTRMAIDNLVASRRRTRQAFLRAARMEFRASWLANAHRDLRQRFPDIFSLLRDEPTWRGPDVMLKGRGIEYPKGWHPLVLRLAAKLTRITPPGRRPICIQVKEKFGGLKFYVGAIVDDELATVIDAAEERSRHTCQECGRRGRMRRFGNWWSTLCDRHAHAERLRIADEVRRVSKARRLTGKEFTYPKDRAAAPRKRQ